MPSTQRDSKKDNDALVLEKLELEIEDIRTRLDEKRSNWWVRPVYLSIMAPILVGLATFFYNYSTGVYESERRIKEAELKIKDAQVEEIEIKRALASLKFGYCKIFDDIEALKELSTNKASLEEIKNIAGNIDTTLFIFEISESKHATIVRFDNIHRKVKKIIENTEANSAYFEDLIKEPKKLAFDKLQAYSIFCDD